MDHALAEARAAAVTDAAGRVLATSGNEVEARRDPTAHAEILALRQAAATRGEKLLADATLHVTLEPCAMCAAAISFFRVKRLVFGAYDPKGGGVEHGGRFYAQPTCHHAPEVIGGVRESAAATLLRDCFAGLLRGDAAARPAGRPRRSHWRISSAAARTRAAWTSRRRAPHPGSRR
jgi:tRNA(Arg) A34 adenosine deaminase TadA